ncbi:hypothetical protein, partial [Akkermansia sp.]|uniref:hypothetical protein n=1 Tax=Akkermansia sp. TaxID=1872421 RepID=UPI003AF15ADF
PHAYDEGISTEGRLSEYASSTTMIVFIFLSSGGEPFREDGVLPPYPESFIGGGAMWRGKLYMILKFSELKLL